MNGVNVALNTRCSTDNHEAAGGGRSIKGDSSLLPFVSVTRGGRGRQVSKEMAEKEINRKASQECKQESKQSGRQTD
ncbi:hypothetical protein E2C01_079044 [Portunus trituberculatus]|uniref:Uncharacterized protein n=1 Tax=Portunus trituberculatus TaxID=210409 RepID=A0A5B7IS80_PORTR|nr:hypothetical protein [Portunus trituberculatus]